MVDYLKLHIGQSAMSVARRIGMPEHTMKNIKAGRSYAERGDIEALLSVFPELAHFPYTPSIPNPTTAQEAPATYHTTPSPTATAHTPAPEGILPALARIEATQQELLHHLLERSRQDAATIQRLLAIIEATTTTTPR